MITTKKRITGMSTEEDPSFAPGILSSLHHIVTATAFLLAVTAPSLTSASPFVFVSISGENRIATFAMDPVGGTLGARGHTETEGDPGPLTTDPGRKFLFASLRDAGKISSFAIDHASGKLAARSTVAVDPDPSFLAVDGAGRFLLSAYYRTGKVAVHAIGADGSIQEPAIQWLPTAPKAHAVTIDRTDRFAFVPHTGPEAIFQFRFDSSSGTLTANSPPTITTPPGSGPRHLVFHPSLDVLYCSNEQGGSVSVYRSLPRRGTLTAAQTLPTLPGSFTGANACADIEVTPDGKFVYVSNRGHDSLAGFATSKESGLLHPIGITATEKTPRSFNIGPSGKYLYAAGQGSGKLAAFRIDQKSGALDRIATYHVGSKPWWVLVVSIGITDKNGDVVNLSEHDCT